MTGVNGTLARPARILIVDDERHNRQLLEVMLQGEGFDLVTADSGEAALALVTAAPPDLILLDVMMPGMDGYQVASKIKGDSRTKNIPIIIVTALDDRNSRLFGLNAGAEDFLNKPVNRAELTVRVRNLLKLKAYGDFHDSYSQILETEVQARTAELAESERLYRSTFDAAPVGIVHLGLDGEWLRVNQRLCDMLGYGVDKVCTEAFRAVVDAARDPIEIAAFDSMIAGTLDRHTVDEKRFRRHDGSMVFARVNMSVHRDADGAPHHVISVIEDITDRRTLEAQVRQAGKMDAIGRLASGVAHDFNNLLTVILGFAELLAQDETLDVEHGKDLAEIRKAATSAAGLTKQLLAFSRQQVLHAGSVDVNALITDMTAMLGRLIGENMSITLDLARDLSPAFADRSQVEQVLMNLVVNARDAMPDKGSICIETSEIALENSCFHDEVIMSGSYVMFAVTDSGAGMSRETQARVFEPFFTTKGAGQGTGLGLSTTYGIVKQSKGYIWVYSELGLGTTIKVYLPLANAGDGEPVPPPETPRSSVPATETILLVEDDSAVCELAKRVLETAGYRVLIAASGDEAEIVFMRHAASVDMILTDIVMPGCGGPELVARLRERAAVPTVLYMSGYTERAAAEKIGLARGTSLLQKPFTGALLLQRVRDGLDR